MSSSEVQPRLVGIAGGGGREGAAGGPVWEPEVGEGNVPEKVREVVVPWPPKCIASVHGV